MVTLALSLSGKNCRVQSTRASLVTATLIALGVLVYGVIAGSASAIGVGIVGFLVGGLTLKLLG